MALPPGPKKHVIAALWSQLRAPKDRDMLQEFVGLARTYGDIMYYKAGPLRLYVINHPDYVREVLVEQADRFGKGDLVRRPTKRLFGEGLVSSNGDFWKRQRKLIQPAFHHQRIAAYAQVMVNYTLKMLEGWHNGQTRQLNDDMNALSLNIVAKTLFDADLSQEASSIGEAVETVIETVTRKFSAPVPMPDWLPTSSNRQERHAVELMDSAIFRIIAEWRVKGEDRGDLLSMLLMARDENGDGMSDQQVRDEVMTLLVAGHETTANALTWAWYLLAQNHDIEARLHDEISIVLGDRVPGFADLPNLPYLEMVVKEAMRLYPPAPIFTREAFEDTEIGGYSVTKGSTVVLSPYVVQRDARWFPEPERFLPERWSAEFEKTMPRHAYFPFGGGPRVCIGNSFAMMEARLVIAAVTQRYRLRLDGTQDVRPASPLSFRPKNGLWTRLVERPRAVLLPQPVEMMNLN